MRTKNFVINDACVTNEIVVREWGLYDGIPEHELTDEQLLKMIKGEDRCRSVSDRDHPEFDRLREQLAQEGYIEIQRGWWNGDKVLKPFRLNGKLFRRHDQFPCGAAMRGHLKFMP